jgi:hypothetical protein
MAQENDQIMADDTAPELFESEAAQRSEILHKVETGTLPPRPLRQAGHEIVMTQPLLVLGTAIALGYAVTRLLSRRR